MGTLSASQWAAAGGVGASGSAGDGAGGGGAAKAAAGAVDGSSLPVLGWCGGGNRADGCCKYPPQHTEQMLQEEGVANGHRWGLGRRCTLLALLLFAVLRLRASLCALAFGHGSECRSRITMAHQERGSHDVQCPRDGSFA